MCVPACACVCVVCTEFAPALPPFFPPSLPSSLPPFFPKRLSSLRPSLPPSLPPSEPCAPLRIHAPLAPARLPRPAPLPNSPTTLLLNTSVRGKTANVANLKLTVEKLEVANAATKRKQEESLVVLKAKADELKRLQAEVQKVRACGHTTSRDSSRWLSVEPIQFGCQHPFPRPPCARHLVHFLLVCSDLLFPTPILVLLVLMGMLPCVVPVPSPQQQAKAVNAVLPKA
jgi:hypothetical protein